MGYINKIDEKEKDKSKVVGARVSEDVLAALSMAEADSERFGYSISITEIIKQALNDTLNEINLETKIDYYKLAKWLKKIKQVYLNVSRLANVGIEHDPIFEDYSFLLEPNLSGAANVSHSSFIVKEGVFKKMKDGKIGSTPSIDLHGQKIEAACKSMSGFIQHHSDLEFIHIIHGKGYHSDDGLSIMKSQVVYYLKQHPKVLAFCSCQPEMGGTGALYVYLKPSESVEFQLEEFSKELREEILLDIKSQRIDFENCLKEREQSLYSYWNQRLNEGASFELNEKGEIRPMSGTIAL
jgi:DNA-nicking Smr family endonuclease